MFAAVDVQYLSSGEARAALVAAPSAAFSEIVLEKTVVVADVAPYQPGAFYLRELPCLRALLRGMNGLSLLVVDGYVDLDPAGKPGLGMHAHLEFGVPVIGVAKTLFATATRRRPSGARDRDPPLVRDGSWLATRRSRQDGARNGGAVPATRRSSPRRRARPFQRWKVSRCARSADLGGVQKGLVAKVVVLAGECLEGP